jgi:heptosyltransferase-2
LLFVHRRKDIGVRILVVQTAFLGDVVLTLPLVEALQRRFQGAQVDLLTVPAHAPLLGDQPGVCQVLTYDKRGTQRGPRGFVQVVRQVRARHYDLAFAPHRSVRSALLLACSGIPRRIGFRRWLTQRAFTATVIRPAGIHEVRRNMGLLDALGGDAAPTAPRLAVRVTAASRRQAQQCFAAHGVKRGECIIGMIPGSQWGTKRWPAERFARLAQHLRRTAGARCVLFGAAQDRECGEAITAACDASMLDLIGHTTLQDLPAYLAWCRLVVCNDTGPMHIAAALGKPIVALFGPTTPALGFAPYGVLWEEASVALACRPCHAHGPQRCPLSHWRCMLELSVEQVAARVQRLLVCTTMAEKDEYEHRPD